MTAHPRSSSPQHWRPQPADRRVCRHRATGRLRMVPRHQVRHVAGSRQQVIGRQRGGLISQVSGTCRAAFLEPRLRKCDVRHRVSAVVVASWSARPDPGSAPFVEAVPVTCRSAAPGD